MSAPEPSELKSAVICQQLERHWRMCRALRHGSPPANRKAAGSYFNLRRGMADTRIEHKALQFVPIPLDTPA